jgi:hypothetical protein
MWKNAWPMAERHMLSIAYNDGARCRYAMKCKWGCLHMSMATNKYQASGASDMRGYYK